ncbi:ABC transporter ATP-binding protein [Enterocloster aldenensis]|jgi:general nucleoside transport system ATP-binding protein|uniref:ABC transporter ATP-binding protein n=1 Tax=Enterocloster aldenensis TaxID=358742 RepID=UPI000E41AAA1|nr:ABC transporter ATP-binding protein [uncultured Lachnoclostridium sp.]RGC21412.1 ABC transporter ATP-binding protein [Enterocloster aldenensis]
MIMGRQIELKKITKVFGKLTANSEVDFTVESGKIYGLIGENGAGKTTLMRVLYGMYEPDGGEILIDGKAVRFKSPKDAIDMGIGMVHQHFALVPTLTVTQNMILGKPIQKKNGLLDMKQAEQMVLDIGKQYKLEVPPKALVKDIPVSLQQRVEILKALYLGADLLIMDEPTAVLTPQEIVKLFETLVELRNAGKSIILITHKLNEIMQITDEIMVLRLGKVTGHVKTSETDERRIAEMMVGRQLSEQKEKKVVDQSQIALEAERLEYVDKWGVKAVDDISFTLHKGEILGIAGVQGNGQSELIDILTGMVNDYKGTILIEGREVSPSMGTRIRREYGMGCIPEDRQLTGAAVGATILSNFIMEGYRSRDFAGRYFINYKKAKQITWDNVKKFTVKTDNIMNDALSLSGGNLQKLIVARELYLKPSVLIAAQPSRGVDIGATEYIHDTLVEHRNQGNAVLLVSNELSEIMAISDRILVIYNGRFVGEVNPGAATEEEIGLLMAGIVREGTAV